MRQFIARLRHRVWPEVWQAWPFFLFLAGPAVALLLAFVAGRLLNRGAADQVRYFGTWLQLFGLALVAEGVRELRREFNRPAVLTAMRNRSVAIVRSLRRRDLALNVDGATIALSGVAATLSVGKVGTTLTTEQRLDQLERDLADLRKQTDEQQQQLQGKLSEVRAELDKEKQDRTAADAAVTQKLNNVAVGGLHLDVIGLWWLLLATVATSVPDELIRVGRFLAAYIS